MLWYLLKTWAGREEEVVKEIQRSVPEQMYKECFVIYQERIWKKQQKTMVQLKPAFPGCAFLTCSATTPVWHQLERIPIISKLIAIGSLCILPMMAEDGRFLERISGKEHVIRLSYVLKDEAGNIRRLSGPLKLFQGQVEKMQYKKRYAMVYHRLWGEERRFVLGIVLKEDLEEKLLHEQSGADLSWCRDGLAGSGLAGDGLAKDSWAGDGLSVARRKFTEEPMPVLKDFIGEMA